MNTYYESEINMYMFNELSNKVEACGKMCSRNGQSLLVHRNPAREYLMKITLIDLPYLLFERNSSTFLN